MRVAWILTALFVSGTFLSGTLSFAQDKPLGDVATRCFPEEKNGRRVNVQTFA
jgi:hypothetical protein